MEVKREIYFQDELLPLLKKGIDKLSDAVKTTMGPKGKLVLIQKQGHPIVTKDGVTVATAVNLENEVENLGAQIIKEAASRTADQAGDGTTTATVLAQSIFNEGLKMKLAGFQPDLLCKGIYESLNVIKSFLEKNKKDIKSDSELYQVATISANGESDIAKLIVSAIKESGPDGSVIVEEAKGFKSELTIVDGFRLERGFLSPYFVTDKNKMNCEFENPLILLADREFNSIHDIMKPLEASLEANKPILLIANDISGEAMQGLVLNKTKGSLRVCAIKSPGFGASRHEMLNDIQAIVGGTVLTDSFDMSEFKLSDFGKAKKIIVRKSLTMILNKDQKNDSDSSPAIKERINAIKKKINSYETEDIEKELLNYRLQQLSGGVAILRIGAATESELIERYDRVDDALNATRAALQEGILAGGGISLAKTAFVLSESLKDHNDPDIKAGIEVMIRSVTEPFKQIIRNGSRSPDSILDKINKKSDIDIGYDARTENFGNMYDIGIIDPYKVTRCAIENAVSAACMLLNSECGMITVNQNSE